MSLLENIKTGAQSELRRQLLTLNQQIAAAERDLAGLKSDRDHLLSQVDTAAVALGTLSTGDNVPDPMPDYASESQWQPADSLDQETADPNPHGYVRRVFDPTNREQARAAERQLRVSHRMARRFATAEANLGRPLFADEVHDMECESDA